MASPSVRSSTSGNSGGNATSTTITYPATISAGDVLVMFVGGDGNLGCVASGWTFVQIQDSGSGMSCVYGLRDTVASGSEGGTTFSLSTNNESFGWTIYAISGCEFAGILSAATVGGSSTGNPDPPSKSPDASRDWLFMAAGGWDGNRSLSSYPTNYSATNSQQTNRVAASTGGGVASAGRQLTTGSAEDPGVFTISAADEWAAITVAFPPAIPKTQANAPTATATGAALAAEARPWRSVNAPTATAVGVALAGETGDTTVGQDSFTGISQILTSHTPEVGASWVDANPVDADWYTAGDHAYNDGPTDSNAYACIDYLTTATIGDCDLYATSAGVSDWICSAAGWGGLLARLDTAGTALRGYVAGYDTTGYVRLWRLMSDYTVVSIAAFDHSSLRGAPVKLRFQVRGSSPTTLRVRVWAASGSEPGGWDIDTTDNTATQIAWGHVGIAGYWYDDGVATDMAQMDDLLVTTPGGGGVGMARVTVFAPTAAATGAALTATADTQQGVTETKVYPDAATATGAALTASVSKFENVQAPAGLATATGAALGAGGRPEKLAPAGLATATGSALVATAAHFENVRANAGLAAASGSALGAPASEGAIAPVAGASGSALAPTANISVFAGSATATGAGLTATVQTTGAEPVWHPWSATWSNTVSAGTAAPAGLATAAGAALAATASVMENVRPAAGLAQATGAALAPVASEGAVAGIAQATGAAQDATVSVSGFTSAPAGLATATGAALMPSPGVGVPAGLAAATGAALAPAARPERRADAERAQASGTALAPTIAVAAIAPVAVATGAALDATASTSATVNAPAALATATGAALVPSVTVMENVRPTAGLATATGLALVGVAVGERRVIAGLASATGAALAGQVSLGAIATTAAATAAALDATVQTANQTQAPATLATATGAAYAGSVQIAIVASTATATGTALVPGARVAAFAGLATATGQALVPQGLVGKYAPAGLATATGTALTGVPWLAAMAERAQAVGVAYEAMPPRTAVWFSSSSGGVLPGGSRMTSGMGSSIPEGDTMEPGSVNKLVEN